jgi:predicted dehydrogenase
MPAQPIRIGFIGCGGVSNGHANQIAKIPEAKIVALTDPNAETVKKFQERHAETKECPVFTDYQKMLSKVELDAVEIHSPHTLHFEQIMAALDKGLHVLTEKPMVCAVEHAKEVVTKAEQTGKAVLVSYQRHYQSEFRYVKEVIASGRLGTIQFISALQCQNWLEGVRGTWRQDPALSGGGQLNDSGSHLLDILLWTTGLGVSEVAAFIDNLGVQVDINSALSFRFDNGAQGNISVVGNAPMWWEDITIWGSEGMLIYRNGKLTHKQRDVEPFEPTEDLLPRGSNPDRNFINAILGREEVKSPPVCGLRVIELTEAAWQSAANGGQPAKVKK